MSEIVIVWVSFLKILYLAIISLVYALAGRGVKIWGVKIRRRWVIPILLITGAIGASLLEGTYSNYYLIAYLTFMAVMHLGYGANSWLRKMFGRIGQRAIIGFFWALAGLPLVWVNGAWILFGYQIILAISAHIMLGAFNPVTASEEEPLISLLCFLCVLFYI